MKSWPARLRHAFAVDPAGPCPPTAEQEPAVDWFCLQIAKRHLSTPGLIALEMSRPMNYLASQMLQALSPGVWAVVPQKTHAQYRHFAQFLERRGSVEYLVARIEELEQEARQGGASTPHPEAKNQEDCG